LAGRWHDSLTKLACAALAIAMVANGDTAGKSSSNAGSTINPLSAPVNGWSGWVSMPLARDQGSVVSFNEKAIRSVRSTSSTPILVITVSTPGTIF
jgi:hypothetical protein